MDKNILIIYNLLQIIACHFGNHGIYKICCEDLSFAEYIALKIVYENDQPTIQFIGHALNFTKSGSTKIINRLEQKGYVVRQDSPQDGRFCCVSITTKGIETISKIIKDQSIYLEKILKNLTPEKKKDIKNALEILVNSFTKNKLLNIKIKAHQKGE